MTDLDAFVAVRMNAGAALDAAHNGGFDRPTGDYNKATSASWYMVADLISDLDEMGKRVFGWDAYVTAVSTAQEAAIAPRFSTR